MPTLPSFETERLLVKPRTMADFDASLAMDREPGTTRFIDGPWHDPLAHERFVRERIETVFGDGLGYWSVFPRAEPTAFVGWILLIPEDATGPDVEIGWRFVTRARGLGYATEAARPVVDHAFRTVRLDKIVAEIDRQNIASLRVAEKLGLVATERQPLEGGRTRYYRLDRTRFLAAARD